MFECFLLNIYSIDVMAPFCIELQKRGYDCHLALDELFWRVSYGENFDIEFAKNRAKKWGVELKLKLNYDIEVAVTQYRSDWSLFSLYKNLKARLSYNVMLHKKTIFADDYGFDYYFVYGNHEENVLLSKGICKNRIVKIGAPKLKYECLNFYKKKNKKVITYLPTWDEYNNIDLAIEKLSKFKEYELYVKPHWLQKKKDLEKLKKHFKIIDKLATIKSVVEFSDAVVVDLKSGALFDVIYHNPKKPLIALSKKSDLSQYFDLYKKIYVVNEYDEIEIKKKDYSELKNFCFIEEFDIKEVNKRSLTSDTDELFILKQRLEKSYKEFYGCVR